MIVGSGLVASALDDLYSVVQYAAGVSNSKCDDADEFTRDKERLASHLHCPGLFCYFSTCSDGETPYVQHKRECEKMVQERGDYLICRLPIVAGRTSNPHTLLNYLHSRIRRSEKFDLMPEARRNIIDVRDAASIVRWLFRTGAKDEIVNVAAPFDYPMLAVVGAFERLIGKSAIFRKHPGGGDKRIDTSRIKDFPIYWGDEYLDDVLAHIYG